MLLQHKNQHGEQLTPQQRFGAIYTTQIEHTATSCYKLTAHKSRLSTVSVAGRSYCTA